MTQYRYVLDVYAKDLSCLLDALRYLKEEKITPYIVAQDYENLDPQKGELFVSLSTNNMDPSGSSGCWEAENHNQFFHDMSLRFPGATFHFFGEDLDDPFESKFKKAFRSGYMKEVSMDMFDLDAMLDRTPWHPYGSHEVLIDSSWEDQKQPVTVLTCIHQTRHNDYIYSSIHPNEKAALAAIPLVKQQCDFDPDNDEFFNFDIDNQILDLVSFCSSRSPNRSLDELLALAGKEADQQTNEPVSRSHNIER